jgi:hypothetical protein
MKIKEPINFLYKLSEYDFISNMENTSDSCLKIEDIISLLLSNYKDIKIYLIKKLKDYIENIYQNEKIYNILLFFNTYLLLIELEKENSIVKILILENIERFLNIYLNNKANNNMLTQIFYTSLIIIIKALNDKNKDVSLKAFLIINNFINQIPLRDKEIIFRFLSLKDKIKIMRMYYLPLSFFINLNKYTINRKEQKLIINNLIENIDYNKTEFEEILQFYQKFCNIFKTETNKLLENYIKNLNLEKLLNIIDSFKNNLLNLEWIIKYLILKRVIREIEDNKDLLKNQKITTFLKEMSLDENSIIRKLIIDSPTLPYYLRINAYKKRQIKLKISKSLSINYL